MPHRLRTKLSIGPRFAFFDAFIRAGRGLAMVVGIVVAAAPSATAQMAQGAWTMDPPKFIGTASELPPHVIAEMTGKSWKPNCPVPLSALRLLTLTHHTPTGEIATGELVVHESVAERVVAAFAELYAAKFPIERMQRIDAYNASDDDSMRANNTSAFNCRAVTGGRGFSKHSYGVAIDINPLINPYVKRRGAKVVVEPESGRPYVERDATVPGLIVKGDAVHRAFTSRGFAWGGTWRRVQDYQHFEAKKPVSSSTTPKNAAPNKQ